MARARAGAKDGAPAIWDCTSHCMCLAVRMPTLQGFHAPDDRQPAGLILRLSTLPDVLLEICY